MKVLSVDAPPADNYLVGELRLLLRGSCWEDSMSKTGRSILTAVSVLGGIGLLAGGCSKAATPTATNATTTTTVAPTTTTTTVAPTPTSAAPGKTETVPSVTGEELDQAEATLISQNLGYNVIGGGIFGVVVAANWTVCSQSPAAGSSADAVQLVVARACSS